MTRLQRHGVCSTRRADVLATRAHVKLKRLVDRVRLRAAHRRHAVRAERLILVHSGRAHAISRQGPCVPASNFAMPCLLCELMWTGPNEKTDWTRLRKELAIPLDHAFEASAGVGSIAVNRALPCIVVVTVRSHELLLDADALNACAGDVQRLLEEIRRSARVRGIDTL
jgi:hypothetical protein